MILIASGEKKVYDISQIQDPLSLNGEGTDAWELIIDGQDGDFTPRQTFCRTYRIVFFARSFGKWRWLK